MKKRLPRLVLKRETIRQLEEPALPWVVGGLSLTTAENPCGTATSICDQSKG